MTGSFGGFFQKWGGNKSRSAQWLEEFRSVYTLLVSEKRLHYTACLGGMALGYYGVYYLGGFVLLSGLTFTIPGCGMQFQYPLASPPFFTPSGRRGGAFGGHCLLGTQ